MPEHNRIVIIGGTAVNAFLQTGNPDIYAGVKNKLEKGNDFVLLDVRLDTLPYDL
jgi:hypothetical protein